MNFLVEASCRLDRGLTGDGHSTLIMGRAGQPPSDTRHRLPTSKTNLKSWHCVIIVISRMQKITSVCAKGQLFCCIIGGWWLLYMASVNCP